MENLALSGHMVNCLDDSCDWMNFGSFEEAKALAEEHEFETGHPVAIDVKPNSEKWNEL